MSYVTDPQYTNRRCFTKLVEHFKVQTKTQYDNKVLDNDQSDKPEKDYPLQNPYNATMSAHLVVYSKHKDTRVNVVICLCRI